MHAEKSSCWSTPGLHACDNLIDVMQAKVAVLGAAGGIGQPLSLLLKSSNLIGELSLYDVANTAGVACDLSHISSAARVKGYTGPNQLQDALRGCQLVVIPAGELWLDDLATISQLGAAVGACPVMLSLQATAAAAAGVDRSQLCLCTASYR